MILHQHAVTNLAAFRVEPWIWMLGLALITLGLAWHVGARLLARRSD